MFRTKKSGTVLRRKTIPLGSNLSLKHLPRKTTGQVSTFTSSLQLRTTGKEKSLIRQIKINKQFNC